MKKVIAIILIAGIVLLSVWCWAYQSYLEVQDRIVEMNETGDWAGAMEQLRAYQSRRISYVVYNIPLLERFKLRLRYNEGVVSGELGDLRASESAFHDAVQSAENDIAASALYNLALYAISRDNLDVARSHLSKALLLNSSDTETKVNLELVLRKIRIRDMKIKGLDKKGQVLPSEQWRDMPSDEGESGMESRRSYL
jgi:tetratricopeptide (TPR) repeat protein